MPNSPKLLQKPEAKNPDVLSRIETAKTRIQSILDREVVAHQKTLEQKISDQGPAGKRVDPHLLGLAIMDLTELGRLKTERHVATGAQKWYANRLTKSAQISDRLKELAPIYAATLEVSNHIGDALEVATETAIATAFEAEPRYSYQGHFLRDEARDRHQRIRKMQPPKAIGRHFTRKEADFLIFGFDHGPLCVECKNYREWFYPHHGEIKSTIIKSYELGAIPVFVGRRIHYTTRENFFGPAGIVFHESYYQYYDPTHEELASKAKDKSLLGFSDIRPTHDPDTRTVRFFGEYLPGLLDKAAPLWATHRDHIYAYAQDQMNLAQLYTEIRSPAGGKWINLKDDDVPF